MRLFFRVYTNTEAGKQRGKIGRKFVSPTIAPPWSERIRKVEREIPFSLDCTT